MALKDELKKQDKTKRRERAPLGGRNVLTVKGKDPSREYRIVNDVGDRVEMFKERGWVVEDSKDIRVGDRRVATAAGEGTTVTVHVGGGMKGIVMSIPEELFKEDQAAKQEYVDDTERSLHKEGDYGKLEISKGRR